jgi:hypothetical protein
MPDMDRNLRRVLISIGVLAAVAGANKVSAARNAPPAQGVVSRFGTPLREITPEIRARGLRIDPSVSPKDRAWILAAVSHARPEAQRLVGEVDGLVDVTTSPGGEALPGGGRAIGVTNPGPNGFHITLNTALLDGDASFSRDVTVLHELGHVIDFSLIDHDLAARLDASIPTSGPCVSGDSISGACTAPEERFADTFAKWALRGAVSAAGAGYQIDAPLLDEWGAPLAILAAQAGQGR